MTVKELIENLLECDMEAEVNVELDLKNIRELVDFQVDDGAFNSNNTVYLSVDLSDYEIVDSDRLEELESAEEDING